jgi:hypothetical protein
MGLEAQAAAHPETLGLNWRLRSSGVQFRPERFKLAAAAASTASNPIVDIRAAFACCCRAKIVAAARYWSQVFPDYLSGSDSESMWRMSCCGRTRPWPTSSLESQGLQITGKRRRIKSTFSKWSPMHRAIASCRQFSRGQTIVIVALILPVLVGSVAMGSDVAVLYFNWSTLRNAVDAAVIEGATYLPSSPSLAKSTAKSYGQQNGVKAAHHRVQRFQCQPNADDDDFTNRTLLLCASVWPQLQRGLGYRRSAG